MHILFSDMSAGTYSMIHRIIITIRGRAHDQSGQEHAHQGELHHQWVHGIVLWATDKTTMKRAYWSAE